MRHNSPTISLTIASSGTSSTAVSAALADAGVQKTFFAALRGLTIYGPGTLPETVTVYVSYLEFPTTEWFQLKKAGTAVTIGAGIGETFELWGVRDLKLVAGSGVAADRVFKVVGTLGDC